MKRTTIVLVMVVCFLLFSSVKVEAKEADLYYERNVEFIIVESLMSGSMLDDDGELIDIYIPYKEEVPAYLVQKGDTLSEIAEYFEVPIELLIEYNHIQDPNMIYVGQYIQIDNLFHYQNPCIEWAGTYSD